MLITGRTRDVVAVMLAFAVNGVVIGGWAGSMPSLRDRLGLDGQGIGWLLLATGVAAVASMQLGGHFSDTRGPRLLVLWSLPLMGVGALVMSAAVGAGSLPLTFAGSILIGLGNGTMDVAMNALGVQVEQARPRPVMSRLHAFWSIGSFTGAAVVALAGWITREAETTARSALVIVGLAALATLIVLARITPQGRVVEHHVDGVRTPVPRVAYLLGAMAVCFGLTEGTAMDWSSIHVTDVLEVDPGTGALGLVCVSAFMVVIRLSGDHLVHRFGHVRVVGLGAATAAVGFLLTVLGQSLPIVLLGWSLVGLGVGMIAPQIYGTAGHLGGARVLTRVVTFGYAAFLAGPGIIGSLVSRFGVQQAMLLPLVLAGALVVLVRWMPAVGD
ncbi:MAG TPA: MFS transporter [Dermatophilaceae bacterium]|nr:MFS transporter [Dermatophilaceae bacterium]